VITPFHYLALSVLLFGIGLAGILIRRNILLILLSVELVFNAANLAFVTFSRLHGSLDGQVIVLLSIAVAAAEVTVALAITVVLFRNFRSLQTDPLDLLKG
jgi:NADH-quinone oxidoreductase subunit K